METNPNLPVLPGDVVAGKYKIERVLGSGGFGVVMAATHVVLGDRVALKFLLPHALDKPEIVGRFIREAQSTVRIKSEHVGRVSDVGQLPSGVPYIVMEYLVGSDLAEVLHRKGALPVEDAVDYVLQACEAIAEAHGLGIVHRDLKPSNLFLTRRVDGSPLVKVLDFGIAKASPGEGIHGEVSLTGTQAVIGSPLYMSPEQLRSAKRVDGRADVWSLGVILFELLTGASPFPAESLSAVIAKIIADPPDRLRAMRTDVSPALERTVMRCLEKDLARRWPSVGALAAALAPSAPARSHTSLERIAAITARATETPLSVPSEALGTARDDRPGALTATEWSGASVVVPSRRWRVAVAGIGLVVVSVAATALLLRPSRETPSTASGSTGASPPPPASSATQSPASEPPSVTPVAPVVEPSAAASSVTIAHGAPRPARGGHAELPTTVAPTTTVAPPPQPPPTPAKKAGPTMPDSRD